MVSTTGGGAALSPEGRLVAFVARKDGVTNLWVRALDADEPRQLADTDDAAQPFWSPDSRSLGYFANGNLRRIDIAGGASRPLTSVELPRGGAWLADGTIVFSSTPGPLRIVRATGGVVTPFTVLRAGEQGHRWPRVLPDARTLLYFILGRQPGVHLIAPGKAADPRRIVDASLDGAYVAPLRGLPGFLLTVANDRLVALAFDPASNEAPGSPVAVAGTGDLRTTAGTNRSNLSVANDGTILYVPGSGRSQLAWFRRDGSLIGKAAAPDRYVSVQLSPAADEILAVVEAGAGIRDTWLLDPSKGTRSRITSENRGAYAVWSPDAQRIAFAGQGSGAGREGADAWCRRANRADRRRHVSGQLVTSRRTHTLCCSSSRHGLRHLGSPGRRLRQARTAVAVEGLGIPSSGIARWPHVGVHLRRIGTPRGVRSRLRRRKHRSTSVECRRQLSSMGPTFGRSLLPFG